MKLSVSTLGCPTWTLDEVLARCPGYGYDAIELRGIGNELDLTKTPDFGSTAAVAATKQRILDAGLVVSAVDSSVQFSNAALTQHNIDHGKSSIDLAAGLGAPFVRVFGGAVPEGVERSTAVELVADGLTVLGEHALANGGVIVVLETHDAFSTGAQVVDVLARTDHPRVAALWDLHHPFRHGEAPERTARLLGARVKFAHVKDSRPGEGYCLLGDGDIPVVECLQQLRQIGYDGYVSVEWEKRWHPSIPEPEIAFPQYADKLREYLAGL
jgi:sugar phosphate isomerase/epimerase